MHEKMLIKYQREISRINGLIIGIPVLLDEAREECGFYDDCVFGADRANQLIQEADDMQHRLEDLLLSLEDSINDEYSKMWNAEIEICEFLTKALGSDHKLSQKYHRTAYWNYGNNHRKSQEYDRWRRRVFKRDWYTCRACDRKGERLVAHHLYSYAKYPRYRKILENGITLCVQCHDEFHIDFMGGNEIPCTVYDYLRWQEI
jgi:hypothetical protein